MLNLATLLASTFGSCRFGTQAPANPDLESEPVYSIFSLWGDLPEDVQAKVGQYLDNHPKYVRMMTLPSLDSFLTGYMQLTRLGSKIEAMDSFYRHKSRQLEAVLSRPGLNSEEFLTALWTKQPLPDSEDLKDLQGICAAYLAVLRTVNEKIAESLAIGSVCLCLGGSGITDLSPLAGLTGLKMLDLTGTPVTDLTAIAGLTGLTSLYLEGTNVADLSPLAGLTGLKTLGLKGTPVTDLSPLAGLTGLKALDLEGTPVTDLSSLAGLTGLRDLFMQGTQADPAVLAHLQNLGIIS